MASAQILTNGKALYAYNGTEWVPLNTAGNLVNSTRWQKTTTAAQTSLSGNDDYGDSLIYTPGYEQLYLNGVLLARDVDYTATNGTTITGLTPLTAGHIIEVIAYNNINVGNTYTQAQIDTKIADTFERWTKTVSASGTVISGLDDSSVTLDYTAGLEKVYVNGILLAPEEYVATSGSVVTLDEAVVTNDIIQIHTLKNFRVANHYTINQTDGLLSGYLSQSSASSTYLTQAAGITAATASATYAPMAAGGLVQITPTSIAATGGSGSISATGAVSFTSASAISLNGCFTSTYDNYKLKINISSASTNVFYNLRFRASGSDSSAATYNYYNRTTSSSSGSDTNFYGRLATFGYLISTNTEAQNYTMDVFSPKLNQITTVNYLSTGAVSNPNMGAIAFNNTTSFDGLTIYTDTGNCTGTIRVYGYKD